MQTIIRSAIVVLLFLVVGGIIFSQTDLFHNKQMPSEQPEPRPAVAVSHVAPSVAASVPAAPSPTFMQLSPQDVERDRVEHEKDREIMRALERDVARLTASSLAQNYLMLFQAIIYFLTLLILYGMMEAVKKTAEAAHKAAEAAKTTAEAGKTHEPAGRHRRDMNKFILRRLRGNYQKR